MLRMSLLCLQSAGYPHCPLGVWGLCGKSRLCPRPTSPFFLKALTTLVPPTEHLVCKASCSQLVCVYSRFLRSTHCLPQSRSSIPVSTAFAPSGQAPLVVSKNHRTGVLPPEGASCHQPLGQARPPVCPTLCRHHFFKKKTVVIDT